MIGKQCDLRGEREPNVKRSAGSPGFGGAQRPKRSGQCGEDGATHHEKQFSMEVGVCAAKNKEKLVRKNFRAAQNKQTERAYAANDCRIKPAQFPCALAASECRNENVGKKITEHRKNHRQSPERAHFGDRARAAGEKADEKNRDLSLQTIENSI